MNASAPSVIANIASNRIMSIAELDNSGIQYGSLSREPEILKHIGDSSTVVVTDNDVIFTTDPVDNTYKRCLAALRASGVSPRTILCNAAVIGHIQSAWADDEHHHAEEINKIYDGVDSKAQKFFNSIISEAVNLKASDVKIYIRRDNSSDIFFKVNGNYVWQSAFSKRQRPQYISMMRAVVDYTVIKNGGDSAVNFTEETPMDLQLPHHLEGLGSIKIRMGTIPGEHDSLSVALRIPQNGNALRIKNLKELGFTNEHVALIEDAMKSPFGLILFTGPTGSGKTTAIAAALVLRPDNSPTITLEDPVEISIPSKPSIIQCPIFEDDPELNWSAMLRQSLRQDPDTIMIGEIRDPEVANTLNRAAGTGHLVLSTMHVNSVIDIPSALEHYELPLYKIADSSFLRLVVGSRLVKAVCKHCSTPLAEHQDTDRAFIRLRQYFADSLDLVRVKNDDGCPHCDFTGTSGRKLIAEVVNLDGFSRKLILERQYEAWREHLKSQGWRDMKDHAEELVRSGLVCPFEAESNIISPFGVDSGSTSSFNYNEYRSNLNEKS